jgi:UDP-N-acetylglucosamine--N-acetylmuramyl-(pentapeptide) pyrophosphoryl-undecaprenol N-acetylglucosamine transferase
VLQEQNTLPGLVTRLTAKRARRIYLGQKRAIKHLNSSPDRFLVTGNPVSWNLSPILKAEARKKFGLDDDRTTIFISGGSGGAASINLLINSMKSNLIQKGYNIIWQTGKHWDKPLSNQDAESKNIYSDRFFSQESMFHAYSAANIAIVRCGEMTLAELALAGIPAILVPFPFSSEGHQEANGLAVEADGGGVLIRDSDLTIDKVSDTINAMLEPTTYKSMREAMLSRKRPDAAKLIVDDIMELLA